jgi:hypothetical protein
MHPILFATAPATTLLASTCTQNSDANLPFQARPTPGALSSTKMDRNEGDDVTCASDSNQTRGIRPRINP